MSDEVAVAEDKTMPTHARLKRVEDVLTTEPAFKGKIGKKSVVVLKRDGTKCHFAEAIVHVAKKILADGKEAVGLGKKEILKYGMDVLGVPPAEGEPVAAKADDAEEEGDEPARAPDKAPVASGEIDLSKLNQNISVLSLLVSAEQIAALDKTPGSEKRRTGIATLIAEYAGVSVQ